MERCRALDGVDVESSSVQDNKVHRCSGGYKYMMMNLPRFFRERDYTGCIRV